MSFLLDTNVISEARKGGAANPAVAKWFASADPADLFLSVMVVGELRQGVERARRRDPVFAQQLETWLVVMVDRYRSRILPIDQQIADLWGRLNVPNPLPVVDGLLAATALAHDMTLVTRNTRQVAGTGARLFDPFTGDHGARATRSARM